MVNHQNKFICLTTKESLQLKPFECDITKITNMAEHKKIHTSVKSFECEICKKSFSSNQDLTRHKRVHTGEKPYSCEICKKEFSRDSSLAEHKRVHTGEKPYTCNICKKTFKQNSHLAQHKRIHTGEKPYECEICEKTFNSSSDLTRHKRVHTGEKPNSCDVCQKSYTQNSGLFHHNKTAAHIKKIKSKNINIPLNQSSFVDCGEDINEEIKEEESVDEESIKDPIHQETDACEDLFDYDTIDIEEHKIEPDNFDIDANTNKDNSYENNDHGVNYNVIANIKRRKYENTNIPLTQSNFVDCGETIKEEDIKEEINEVVSVEDPLTFHHEIENSNICEDFKEEINEEETNSIENNC